MLGLWYELTQEQTGREHRDPGTVRVLGPQVHQGSCPPALSAPHPVRGSFTFITRSVGRCTRAPSPSPALGASVRTTQTFLPFSRGCKSNQVSTGPQAQQVTCAWSVSPPPVREDLERQRCPAFLQASRLPREVRGSGVLCLPPASPVRARDIGPQAVEWNVLNGGNEG